MLIQVTEPDYCKLQVHYEADLDQINSKKNEVLVHFKNAPVPGCRKGKASIDAIKIYYHSQIQDSLKRALAEEAYHNTIFDQNIKPFGTPNFSLIDLSKDKFTCDFSLHKKPDITLNQYKNFEIPKPVTQDAVVLAEKMLQDLRVQHGEVNPYETTDFVTMNDNIVIDYEAFDGDIKLDMLCAQGELLTVGHSNLKNFDEALLGMKPGEKKNFSIQLSNDLSSELAGKLLTFNVTLHTGSKVTPMPLSDELAQKVGKENLQELLQLAANTASNRSKELYKQDIFKQISSRLLNNHDFVVPSWLTISEAQYLAASNKLEWDSLSDDAKKVYLNLAEHNVKLGLILDRIREEEPEAQLSDQEIVDMIKKNIDSSNANPDEVLQGMNKNGYLSILVARIRDEQALEFIFNNSTIVE